MSLKTYALRLDEEVYESLKKALEEYGDPDLNISFIVRKYLRDLNEALPNLKKSDAGIMNSLAYWGMSLKQLFRTSEIEHLVKGSPIIERAQAEADNKAEYWKSKKENK
ncbi:MAG: hypothetical protein A2X59_06675 [Nitrospirae bacterium GWC2_42_7]|nr:MAG: hypothetical protein A2X59_06675 [Nitrospirae bacterium GWC2_42_7]